MQKLPLNIIESIHEFSDNLFLLRGVKEDIEHICLKHVKVQASTQLLFLSLFKETTTKIKIKKITLCNKLSIISVSNLCLTTNHWFQQHMLQHILQHCDLTHLECLDLSSYFLTHKEHAHDEYYQCLSMFTKIKTLIIHPNTRTSCCISSFHSPQYRNCCLFKNHDLQKLFSCFSELQHLEVRCDIKNVGFMSIFSLSNLQSLVLTIDYDYGECYHDDYDPHFDKQYTSTCKCLKYATCKFTNLHHLTQLQHLFIEDTKLSNNDLLNISKMKNLKSLKIKANGVYITKPGIELIHTHLTQLTYLSLNSVFRFEKDDLAEITKKCCQLHTLNLSYCCGIGDEECEHFSKMPLLKHLVSDNCFYVTMMGFEYLLNLTSVQFFNISRITKTDFHKRFSKGTFEQNTITFKDGVC